MKNNKYTVIQINGLGGILIVGFLIMCAATGFILFPAWCCMHAWNFIASNIVNMPTMTLFHGAILWVIIALILYATMMNKLNIAFVSKKDIPVKSHEFDIENIEKVCSETEKEKIEL